MLTDVEKTLLATLSRLLALRGVPLRCALVEAVQSEALCAGAPPSTTTTYPYPTGLQGT